jgi:hypothetical protein
MGVSQDLSTYLSDANEFVVKSKYYSKESEYNWGDYFLREKNPDGILINLDIFVDTVFTIFPVRNDRVYFYSPTAPDKPYYNFWDDYFYIYPILKNGMTTAELSKWFELVFYKQDRYLKTLCC